MVGSRSRRSQCAKRRSPSWIASKLGPQPCATSQVASAGTSQLLLIGRGREGNGREGRGGKGRGGAANRGAETRPSIKAALTLAPNARRRSARSDGYAPFVARRCAPRRVTCGAIFLRPSVLCFHGRESPRSGGPAGVGLAHRPSTRGGRVTVWGGRADG